MDVHRRPSVQVMGVSDSVDTHTRPRWFAGLAAILAAAPAHAALRLPSPNLISGLLLR